MKIGFIDLFLDEWHANNFPAFFIKSKCFDGFSFGSAWESVNNGGLSLDNWCSKYGFSPASSLESVVEDNDAICILAPSNPEVHEMLSDFALRSGKPVFVDKPFAPDPISARRMFDLASSFNTPLMSCSALRYDRQLEDVKNNSIGDQNITLVSTTGGGQKMSEYLIHQVEVVVTLLGCGSRRVIVHVVNGAIHASIQYFDSRVANLTYHSSLNFGAPCILTATNAYQINTLDDFFPNLMDKVLTFFKSRQSPIVNAETIEVCAIVEATLNACRKPGVWFNTSV